MYTRNAIHGKGPLVAKNYIFLVLFTLKLLIGKTCHKTRPVFLRKVGQKRKNAAMKTLINTIDLGKVNSG
jgi:CRISPR/Cas system-associated exonuclease Cas4 (RecB family)